MAFMPAAPVVVPVYAAGSGTVNAIVVRAVGMAVVGLGGGRARTTDRINPAVGLSEVSGLGEAVGSDRPLAMVHARNDSDAEAAARALRAAYTVGHATEHDSGSAPAVLRRITRA